MLTWEDIFQIPGVPVSVGVLVTAVSRDPETDGPPSELSACIGKTFVYSGFGSPQVPDIHWQVLVHISCG